ncbi:hypothetical protein DV738_g2621, partial [Chaetothyriales sp. CBS 135597]
MACLVSTALYTGLYLGHSVLAPSPRKSRRGGTRLSSKWRAKQLTKSTSNGRTGNSKNDSHEFGSSEEEHLEEVSGAVPSMCDDKLKHKERATDDDGSGGGSEASMHGCLLSQLAEPGPSTSKAADPAISDESQSSVTMDLEATHSQLLQRLGLLSVQHHDCHVWVRLQSSVSHRRAERGLRQLVKAVDRLIEALKMTIASCFIMNRLLLLVSKLGKVGAGQDGDMAKAVMAETEAGDAIMGKLGNETLKAELGRAAWKLLHTTMARFPDEPTLDESEALKSYIYLFARLYPCGECAAHFQALLRKYPPQTGSRSSAAAWACFVHNQVNERKGKPIFDCSNIGDFYDCGCAEDDEESPVAADTADAAKAGGTKARASSSEKAPVQCAYVGGLIPSTTVFDAGAHLKQPSECGLSKDPSIHCLRIVSIYLARQASVQVSILEWRWLDKDSERRAERCLSFDFQALLDTAVASCPGARSVVTCEKKEGGFNRVFSIQLDNGRNVVARIPTRAVANAGLAVSSEVATLQFVKHETTIPVPAVLSWNSTKTSPVGSEYIVMESVPGVLLKDVWNTMSASQHIRCIQSIGKLTKQLCLHKFTEYGSLFMKNYAPQGSQSLQTEHSVVLGPTHTWLPDGVLPLESDGPTQSLRDYYAALFRLHRLTVDYDRRSKESLFRIPKAETCSTSPVTSHAALLDTCFKILKLLTDLPEIQDAARPILFHPDLHTRNIFVDETDFTKVTGIIDWQSATVSPAFVYAAETPDFAERLELDETLDIPAIHNAATDQNDPIAKSQADAEFCAKAWALVSQVHLGYREANRLGQTLLSFLAAGHFGWLKDPTSLQVLLLNLFEDWNALGLPGHCPYHPSADETERARGIREKVQTTQRLKQLLSRNLKCDLNGWVAESRWDEVIPLYRAHYDDFMASYLDGVDDAHDKEQARREADSTWPFDFR